MNDLSRSSVAVYPLTYINVKRPETSYSGLFKEKWVMKTIFKDEWTEKDEFIQIKSVKMSHHYASNHLYPSTNN